MHFFSCTLYHNVQWRTPVTGILHCREKFIKVLLCDYKRCFSLWPAPVPLYLLFVALNRYERVRPMR